MNLATHLRKDLIFIADTYEDTDSFYADYASFLKEKGVIEDSDAVKRLFVKREGVHSTGIKKGAAAPGCPLPATRRRRPDATARACRRGASPRAPGAPGRVRRS